MSMKKNYINTIIVIFNFFLLLSVPLYCQAVPAINHNQDMDSLTERAATLLKNPVEATEAEYNEDEFKKIKPFFSYLFLCHYVTPALDNVFVKSTLLIQITLSNHSLRSPPEI